MLMDIYSVVNYSVNNLHRDDLPRKHEGHTLMNVRLKNTKQTSGKLRVCSMLFVKKWQQIKKNIDIYHL